MPYCSLNIFLDAIVKIVDQGFSGVQIYRNFYSEEKERSNGVLAICVQIPTSQLRVIMAAILSVSGLGILQCNIFQAFVSLI